MSKGMLTKLVLFIYFSYSNAIQVHILSVINGQNPMFGYNFTAPVIDVAFERAARAFPLIYRNITTDMIYKPVEVSTCGETGDVMVTTASNVFDNWQNTVGFFILISPG